MEKEYIQLKMNSPFAVITFRNELNKKLKAGFSTIKVKVKDTKVYSNVTTPIAGIIDYYKTKGIVFDIDYAGVKSYAESTQIHDPKIVEKEIGTIELNHPFDKVWKFSSSDGVNALVDAITLAVRQSDIVEEGVISTFAWCFNEVMDNVLIHAESDFGYVMAQFHKAKKQISVCIFDPGIGIFNSFKTSNKYHPQTNKDAITLALQEKVTRDDKIGQGNGLWGLSRIIEDGHGMLQVCSGGASYMKGRDGNSTIRERGYIHLGKRNGTTLIDFQINYENPVNIETVLNGYKPTDEWLDKMENDEGDIVVKIAEQAGGTGTRKSAEKMRNMVLNIVTNDKKKVILDFEGVNFISSSFADELLGKVISQYGILFFMNKFAIKNLSSFNNTVLNRSITQRMAQTYYDETLSSWFSEDLDEEK